MKLLHKSLCITDALPNLQNTSFFRRFDDEVIERRRQSALNFLEFLGQHFQLFTSREFIKFFEVCVYPILAKLHYSECILHIGIALV